MVPFAHSLAAPDNGQRAAWGRAVLLALAALSAGDPVLDWSLLPDRISEVLGDGSTRAGIDEEKGQKNLVGSNSIDQEHAVVISSMLDCLIEDDLIPRFYDYDYL